MSKTPAERQREKRKRDIVTPQNVTDVTKRDIPSVTSDGVEFKPECVTCDDLEPDEKGRACCAVDGDCIVEPEPANIRAMSDIDLQFKLNSYTGASWVNTPEHQEVLRRKQAAVPEQGA